MLDLLADRALEGLTAEQERELAELVERSPAEDEETFDALAAELYVASVHGTEEVPAELQQRIRETLAKTDKPSVAPPTAEAPRPALAPANVRWSEIMAWLAAAACLVAAIALSAGPAEQPEAASPVALRETMLEAADDAIRLDWSRGPTVPEQPEGFEFGDVVWSPSRQEGYMRFRGLPVNDPKREQYQLWIFDGTRNEAHPVDGGVFDVTSDGEVVVPIAAKLRVREATLFAVTVEQPGGVVVSDRSRLPLLAPVPAG